MGTICRNSFRLGKKSLHGLLINKKYSKSETSDCFAFYLLQYFGVKKLKNYELEGLYQSWSTKYTFMGI